ncbi:hypothetical protein ACJRO7_013997 [Eucalyptus globulus]|uniref:Uncharacterized protein n=1 Tax=Eucalyptus globulus TaxID=34317 RepID=A0ABD3KZN1_EUCGL
MADLVKGAAASRDVQSLLSSPNRDFLIRNNGDQVRLGSFLFLASPLSGKRREKESWVGVLVEAGRVLGAWGSFCEVPIFAREVLVPVMG